MKVWFVTCVFLFVLVQLCQWMKGFFSPLPLYLLAGALLSLASNYENIWLTRFSQSSLPMEANPLLEKEDQFPQKM